MTSSLRSLGLSLETKGTQEIQHTVDVGYYAPAARTTLNMLCSSCSSMEIELVTSYPPSTHPLGLGGCIPPPGCGLQHHDIWRAR